MKKIVLTLILALCATSVFCANGNGPRFQTDLYAGRGLDDGTKIMAGVNVVYGLNLTPSIYLGVGTGARYVNGLYRQESDATTKALKNNYQTEIVAPVFLRARYMMTSINLSSSTDVFPYISVDGGYTLNIAGKPYDPKIIGVEPKYEGNVKGVFISPQFGFDVAEKFYIGVSYDFQRYNHKIISIGSDKQQAAVFTHEEMTFANIVSFHLGFRF